MAMMTSGRVHPALHFVPTLTAMAFNMDVFFSILKQMHVRKVEHLPLSVQWLYFIVLNLELFSASFFLL